MPIVWSALAVMMLAAGAQPTSAQNARASQKTSKAPPTAAAARGAPSRTSQGAYSSAQAVRGEKAYRINCGSCHAPTAYTGASFLQLWVGRSAYDMVSLLRQTMPNDEPGRLTKQQYVDIVAYLFKLNGYPAGARSLPTADADLRRVAIDRRVTAAP
jgi:mono/diheme cytochrome c family protein